MSEQSQISPTSGSGTASGPGASAPAAPASAQSQSAGAVGCGNYEVRESDCIESIALDHGFFWETIWNDPGNQLLRAERKDPNVLLSGDKVFVPALRARKEPGTTEKRHRFRRKEVPSRLVMIFKDQDRPRANVPYVLEIDGRLISGQTDAQGAVRQPIPPNARQGKLTLGTGDETEEYDLALGRLDPVTELSGVQQRLNELGFACGKADGVPGPSTSEALRAFQAKYGLQQTGEPDAPTRERLVREHGS